MTIQHKDITDPEVHEPKGIVSASANSVYKASGTGTGAWALTKPEELQNNTVIFTDVGKRIVVNASGGFGTEFGPSVSKLVFTGNTNATTLAAAYVALSGSISPWTEGPSLNGSFDAAAGAVKAPVTGIYEVAYAFVVTPDSAVTDFKAQLKTSPATVALLENVFQVVASRKNTISYSAVISLSANTALSLQVASNTATGSIVFNSGALSLKLIGVV